MPDPNPLPVNTELMARCADMLAMPQLACRRRSCKRGKKCGWRFPASGEPCCLANFDGAQRAAFDALYAEALAVRRQAISSWYVLDIASPDPERRALQDAAVEIMRTRLEGKALPRFDKWRRKRERNCPSPSEAETVRQSRCGKTGKGFPSGTAPDR
ncbi:MAG: hypothetical protein QHC90_05845 [Shinella sp.]|nr:hypothetical protein [Shinella sp.]